MTEQNELSRDRIEVALDRGTRVVRLLTWTAMFALVCLMLWVVSGMAAKAEEDPKAAARAIGNAGNAAARAIARDSSNAADVPGYAGTNLPEREHRREPPRTRRPGAARRSRRSRRRGRADGGPGRDEPAPGDRAGERSGGGALGDHRGVAAIVGARRGRPRLGQHGGLRRGPPGRPGRRVLRVRALVRGRGLRDRSLAVEHRIRERDDAAQHGGGAGRRRVRPRRHALLHRPAPRLPHQAVRARQLLQELGLLIGLGNCSASERELAEERNAGNTHYLGRYCSKRTFFGVCIRRSRAWCVFGSKLGRILQQQGRAQLGIGWSSCRGLTVAEVEGIDFARLDLSEFTQDLMDGSREPSVSLPDAGDTGTAMRTRIRDFYRRGQ